MILIVAFQWQNFCVFLFRNTINRTQPYFGWLLLECSSGGIGFNGAEKKLWNCTHFRHPTDEQLRHVDIFVSSYYNLQSVHFELLKALDSGFHVLDSGSLDCGFWIP